MLHLVDHDQQSARLRFLERLLQRHAQELAVRKHRLREELTAEASDLWNENETSIARESRLLGAALVGISSRTVQGIETALQRLREGTYGLCIDCGMRIRSARLRALPFAETCLDCQARRDGPQGLWPPRFEADGTARDASERPRLTIRATSDTRRGLAAAPR